MARGDHFFVWRQHKGVPFQHHAIDVGDGSVVHFTDGGEGVAGPGGATEEFEIRQTPIDAVNRGGRDVIHVVSHRERFAPEVVVGRAISQIGRRGYHLVFDNCEHFACWCVVARDESRQVTVACERLGAAGVKAIAASTARLATRVGTTGLLRGTTGLLRGAGPWMLLADAAQWITEAGGHHVGLRDPQHRKHAGRAIGATTALSAGACGGPAGLALAGSLWAAGEFGGQLSRAAYEELRRLRRVPPIRDGLVKSPSLSE